MGLGLTAFTVFGLLDTFVIVRAKENVSFSFPSFDLSSSSPSSSSSISSSKSNNSSISSSNSSSKEVSSSSSNQVNSSISSSNIGSSYSSEMGDETYFTDTEILTEDRYSNPYMYVKINSEVIKTMNIQKKKLTDTTVFWADVRVKNYVFLKTAFAKNQFGLNLEERTSKMAANNNAIFAVNGDFYSAQEKGYVIRNGQAFRKTAASGREDLAIYKDGSFETFYEKDVTADELIAKDVWQVLSFGPALLKNGEVAVEKDDEVGIFDDKRGNQRTGIGMVSPLHYVFAVCNGRTNVDYGMSLYEMGEYLQSKGCVTGYNLDGGGSSTIWFNGKVLNKPTQNGWQFEERKISDIVYIG